MISGHARTAHHFQDLKYLLAFSSDTRSERPEQVPERHHVGHLRRRSVDDAASPSNKGGVVHKDEESSRIIIG